MTEFRMEREPSADLCAAAAALTPTNHAYTYAFTQAMRRLGYQPWLLSLRREERTVAACSAFLTSGRLNRALEIVSVPAVPEGPAGAPFWEGLLRLCRDARVSQLTLGSFDSTVASIPALPGEVARKSRTEFVLDLERPGLWDGLGSNHLRNIKSSRKAGMAVREATDLAACQVHAPR